MHAYDNTSHTGKGQFCWEDKANTTVIHTDLFIQFHKETDQFHKETEMFCDHTSIWCNTCVVAKIQLTSGKQSW